MASPIVFTAVRDLIEGSFTDAPVIWPNEGSLSDGSAPWVYIDVSGVLTRRIELGIAASEETGIIWCHVFVPIGTGTLAAREIIRTLSRLFMAARDSPLTYGDQATSQGDPGDDDGVYWRQTLTVDYQFQDMETF
jgi:hypothetical protein